ncbi:hypothetical protein ABB37_05751 [Leptomonas pyrrhocoris]|uniref:Uncharacterized protein n=1 Tax=Leptomonas pyrrhocoris TaxID=157538 RepID=A0A0M9FZI3_LEPPY|nr:hypothetical protein ABB37_05751 [Leptomonas pyrrhocoris]KPA79285.1 hypothetical protein ABB37_05751 [Leptomonas pyrrhocoris]|eukprot:XP_015657724.1 hypothetical protein ABB37_05751 [Leptomonas pyrrhocoris]
MSGAHQYYTATGRALPLPPKRTPSRHSDILRLPTHRAEEQRSITVRADSPGRTETPRGGEFHDIPASQRRASQLVVYHGPTSNPPNAPLASPSQSASAASSKSKGNKSASLNVNAASERGYGRPSTSKREWGRILPGSRSRSDSSSPCLNCMKSAEGGDDDEEWWRGGRSDAAPSEQLRSNPISSTHHSRAREEHDRRLSHDHPSSQSRNNSVKRSVRSCSSGMGGSSQPRERSAPFAPHEDDPAQRSWHFPPQPSALLPHVNESQAAASSQRDNVSCHRQGPPSRSYSEKEVSPPRSVGSRKGNAEPQHRQTCNGSSRCSSGNARRATVDRHDHLYSQQKIEERRASQSAAVESRDTPFRSHAGSQAVALAPAAAEAKRSTRALRSDADPLEMNTPIADRVRQRSVASANHYTSATPHAAGTLEGTELLPSLPRLQGCTTDNGEDGARTYCTVVRFIEYQPETERQTLEAMLHDFNDQEGKLCALLTEVYGEDFYVVKSACPRGPSQGVECA